MLSAIFNPFYRKVSLVPVLQRRYSKIDISE